MALGCWRGLEIIIFINAKILPSIFNYRFA
jgi:hypothetical protein